MKLGPLKYPLAFAALFALPFVELALPARTRSSFYMTLPSGRGAYGDVEREIFEDDQNADMAFLGSSTLVNAIDVVTARDYLQERLGRKAVVHVLAYHDAGPDVQWLMLRDYLQTHHPKLVVVGSLWRRRYYNGASPSLADFADVRDYPSLTEGLGPKDRLAVYAQLALYSPRSIYDSLEPRTLTADEKSEATRQSYLRNARWSASFFRPLSDSAKAIAGETPPAHLTRLSALTGGTSAPSSFAETFYRKIGRLLAEKGVPFVVAYLPEISDVDREPTLPANSPLAGLGEDATVVYSDLLRKSWQAPNPRDMFYDDVHLSGASVQPYTRSVLSAVLPLIQGGR